MTICTGHFFNSIFLSYLGWLCHPDFSQIMTMTGSNCQLFVKAPVERVAGALSQSLRRFQLKWHRSSSVSSLPTSTLRPESSASRSSTTRWPVDGPHSGQERWFPGNVFLYCQRVAPPIGKYRRKSDHGSTFSLKLANGAPFS